MTRLLPLAATAALLASVAAQSPGPELTEADLARADAIHARILTLDTHKDIDPKLAPAQLPADPATRAEFVARFDPSVRGKQQVDFPKMREGGYDCAFFIVYTDQRQLNEAGYRRALAEAEAKFDAIDRMVARFPDTIGLARSADDVERLHREGKLIACIGIENGYPMGLDVANVARFHARGARYMSITHNGHTQLGDSHTPVEGSHGGLSELGRRAIEAMNEVGIMVDISHAGRTTMLQATAHSKAPVIASHSGARAVCDHSRNLDDEQLRALAQRGGVVQCVALADFVKQDAGRAAAVKAWMAECGLGGGDELEADERERRWERFRSGMGKIDAAHPKAAVADFVDHIDHVVRTVGIDHVGIGSDFDGGGGISGWNDASESRNVTRELVRRGYDEAAIQKIWGGNLLRVWRQVERIAARPADQR
ncbi:MAG: dipeptidase [Planctomycetes bacterium]|jgi:membrane dipeptidase|nr:dipeptidase [Planctomycetota bacterium]